MVNIMNKRYDQPTFFCWIKKKSHGFSKTPHLDGYCISLWQASDLKKLLDAGAQVVGNSVVSFFFGGKVTDDWDGRNNMGGTAFFRCCDVKNLGNYFLFTAFLDWSRFFFVWDVVVARCSVHVPCALLTHNLEGGKLRDCNRNDGLARTHFPTMRGNLGKNLKIFLEELRWKPVFFWKHILIFGLSICFFFFFCVWKPQFCLVILAGGCCRWSFLSKRRNGRKSTALSANADGSCLDSPKLAATG